MKEIQLTRGKVAMVDDEDFEYLNQWKWYCNNTGYAERNIYKNEKRTTIRIHQNILEVPSGMHTDHINHNTLDNRKCNLRICTQSQNKANGIKYSTNKSGYKGVSWYKLKKKWRATIQSHGKWKHLGYFDNKEEAARAYNKKSKELDGEFALLNPV